MPLQPDRDRVRRYIVTATGSGLAILLPTPNEYVAAVQPWGTRTWLLEELTRLVPTP